jgi:DNA end-binding protein Ku
MFERSYYLEPDSRSPKAYALLRKTLEETDRTAIVKFAIRQRTRLAALRVRGNVLVLQTLLWGDEVREANFPSLDEDVKVTDKELQMSSALVKSFESDFTPEDFTDEYQEQLRTLIDAKLEAGAAVDTAATFGEKAEPEGGEVLDLMEALRRSVERSRGAAAEGDDDEKPAAKKSSRAKKADDEDEDGDSAEKKPAGKKSAPKSTAPKSTTKKAAAKKPA